jgi:hypothetical protein
LLRRLLAKLVLRFTLCYARHMPPFAPSPRLVSSQTNEAIGRTSDATAAPTRRTVDPWLSREELKKRVKRSPLIVKEIYEIAQRQVQAETGRQARLDAKATSLMGAVGLCLTVAFTFGGLVLKEATAFVAKLGDTRLSIINICFALAIFFGIGAGALALKALLVKGTYLTMSEDAVFNEAALDTAESQEDSEVGLAAYRRFILVQLWDNARIHGRNHEVKAKDIRRGQICFALFLGCLLVICVSVVTTIR